jgi:ferredoxin-NADP reductase
MQEGMMMNITGIAGDIFYLGDSRFMVRNPETKVLEEKTYKKVGMIAAGSGLTPMFQLI